MSRLKAVFVTACFVLLVGLALTTCDQGTKKVKIRLKFQPGMSQAYQQVTRGLIQVADPARHLTLSKEYVETTMDISLQVRRVLEDSTAELLTGKKWQRRVRNMLDSTTTDTVDEDPKEGESLIEYVKPNGRMVGVEFVSDTAKGNLDYLKEYYEQGSPVFPDAEVGQGHSWTQTTTVVLPDGPVEASTTYTIKSFARERGYDCVVIEYDGVMILPLPLHTGEKYDVISGVDNITSKGHLYFAYKEGLMVLFRERWVLNSERSILRKEADTLFGYQPGDTVALKVGIEYDVDYYLTDAKSQ
jgi:hypothetical protein